MFLKTNKENKAINDVKQIVSRETLPEILSPKIRVKENKGDNSIYISEPWQCKYCKVKDVSCPGALAPEHREIKGIVAKENGEIYPYKEEYRELIPIIEENMEVKAHAVG